MTGVEMFCVRVGEWTKQRSIIEDVRLSNRFFETIFSLTKHSSTHTFNYYHALYYYHELLQVKPQEAGHAQ